MVSGTNSEGVDQALAAIEGMFKTVNVGDEFMGKVVRLTAFGAFVEIAPGKDGLVHISQISDERVEKVSERLNEGDVVKVKVLEIDRQGRVRLSIKEAIKELEEQQNA